MSPFSRSDEVVSELTESTARRLTRRQTLYRGLKGVVAGTAALTVANLSRVPSAFAASCSCGPSASCQSHGYSCPGNGGCDTGHGICSGTGRTGSCVCCNGGQWVACTHCAHGAGSYRVCTDCYLSSSGCSHCDCLSNCLCTGCDTVEDMVADMRARGFAFAA